MPCKKGGKKRLVRSLAAGTVYLTDQSFPKKEVFTDKYLYCNGIFFFFTYTNGTLVDIALY